MTTSALRAGSPVRRWAPWILLAVVAVTILSVAAFGTRRAPTAQDRVSSISRSVKCPVCAGESVAESNAPASQEIRRQIAEQVQQGQTDEQIREYYAAKYGEAILLTPSASGVNALVWILPVVALAIGIAVLVIVFRRWSAVPEKHASVEDRALVDAALRAERGSGSGVADDAVGEGDGR